MKKFISRLVLFLVLLAVLVIPINVLLDPYNVFHWDRIRDNGVEPNKNYIKTQFVLEHMDQYDSYLFGSSRTGFIDVSDLPEGNWYNFSYSEGLPAEQYETLLTLISHGEIPKQVYLGLDNISYLVDPAYHADQLYRKAYPYEGSVKDKFYFFVSYLDTVTTIESLSVVSEYQGDTESLRQRMYSSGCEDLSLDMEFDDSQTAPYWADYYEARIDESIEEIRRFVELCDEYDIELTVFTNPLYITTYERAVDKGYLDFLEQLAYVTPYYNFSSYNMLSMNQEYYYETSHYTPEAASVMMDVIQNGGDENMKYGQGFGYYVTEDNVEEFISIVRHQAYVTGVLQYTGP
ncbi:MAG: hypothetical protein J1E61_00865 [Lachnospiraceae bacterium]|nr:hypothetical protein [Lachnospiraceae bacterium]